MQLQRVPHVRGVHELHVWRLVDGLTIASMHVAVSSDSPWDQVLAGIRAILHRAGVHSVTVQPEFDQVLCGCSLLLVPDAPRTGRRVCLAGHLRG